MSSVTNQSSVAVRFYSPAQSWIRSLVRQCITLVGLCLVVLPWGASLEVFAGGCCFLFPWLLCLRQHFKAFQCFQAGQILINFYIARTLWVLLTVLCFVIVFKLYATQLFSVNNTNNLLLLPWMLTGWFALWFVDVWLQIKSTHFGKQNNLAQVHGSTYAP